MNTATPEERLLDSDLIAPRNQRAILAAIQAANGEQPTPDQFTAAAKEHRASVRIVAAGCGWARCWHCGEWRRIGEELPSDPATCPCTLELEDDDVFYAFALYVYTGGPVLASLSVPASVIDRIERFRAAAGNPAAQDASTATGT